MKVPDADKQRFYQAMGAAIRAAREDAGMSRAKLAAEVGLSIESTLSNVESGQTPCPVYTLYRIALALDVTLDELVPDEVDA